MNVPLNIDWQQILLHAFNFIILAAGLIFLLYKPVKKFMNKREENYKKAKLEAEENREEAERLSKEVAERKANIDKEVADYRAAEIKKVNAEAQARLEEAKARADLIVPEAEKAANERRKEIIADSEDDITDMVITATKKLSSYSATPATDSSLYDCFIGSSVNDKDNKDD